MGLLRDDRHRKPRGSTLFPGSRAASAQAPGSAAGLLGPQSLGSLVSAPHPNSGHGPISYVLHCNTDHEPLGASQNPASPAPSHTPLSPPAARESQRLQNALQPPHVLELQRPPTPRWHMPGSHALGPAPEEALGGASRGDIGVCCVLELAVLKPPLSGPKPHSHRERGRRGVGAGLTLQLLGLLLQQPREGRGEWKAGQEGDRDDSRTQDPLGPLPTSLGAD